MAEILVKNNVKKQIKESIGVSYFTVRSALLGQTNTKLALKIREKALELGGVEVKDND